jgi:hypothetical protein
MFCVYEHIRPDTNAIFYVGKGSHCRAYSKHRRNKHWNSVVAKAGGYSVRLIADDIEEDLSFLVEMERINQLKRIGLTLTNKTDGGEGPSGFHHTDMAKRKISEAQMGEKHWTFGYEITEEHRAKLRAARAKLVFTDEIRAKLSEAGKRRVYTPETLAKMSKAKQGSGHHMANAVMFENKIFGCAKELAEYTGVNYSTIRTRIRLYPEKFGYIVLGYTKDLKGNENGKLTNY